MDGESSFAPVKSGSQLFLRNRQDSISSPLLIPTWQQLPFSHQMVAGSASGEPRIAFGKSPSAGGSAIEIGSTNVPMIALWRPNKEMVFTRPFQRRSYGRSRRTEARLSRSRSEIGPTTKGFRCEPWLQAPTNSCSRARHRRERGLMCCHVARASDGDCSAVAATPRAVHQNGHLVYSDGDTLFAVPVDERSTPVAPSVPILHGIDHYWGHANVALPKRDGRFLPVESIQEAEIAWLDRQGKATPVPGGTGPFGGVALSPDGTQAAVTVTAECPKCEVWILDLARGTKRLLRSEGSSSQPIWSRDGAFVTYVSTQGDASGSIEREPTARAAHKCWLASRVFLLWVTGLLTGRRYCSPSTRAVATRTSGCILAGKFPHWSKVASTRVLRRAQGTVGSSRSRPMTVVWPHLCIAISRARTADYGVK